MPQRVEIVPSSETDPVKSLLEGQLDLLPTATFFAGPKAEEVLKRKDLEIHETMPFQILMIRFSSRGLSDFTPEQRMYAGLLAGQAFVKHFGPIGGKGTEQFFQTLSDGTLDEDQLQVIRRMRSVAKAPLFPRPIVFGVLDKHYEKIVAELESVPEIKIVSSQKHAIEMPKDERPDMYYVGTDTAWSENLSLLGYNFEVGSFVAPGLKADDWFQRYLSTRDKVERMKQLRELHFDVLRNASIIPIEVAPFYAVANRHWKLKLNKLNAGTELWAIRKR